MRIPDANARAIPGGKIGGPEGARLVVVTDPVMHGEHGCDIPRAFRILRFSQERTARGIECMDPTDDGRPVEGGHARGRVQVAAELQRAALPALQIERMQCRIRDPHQDVAPPIGLSGIPEAFLACGRLDPRLDDQDPIVQAEALAVERHEVHGLELPAVLCGPILDEQAVGIHGETVEPAEVLFQRRPGRRHEMELPPGRQQQRAVVSNRGPVAHGRVHELVDPFGFRLIERLAVEPVRKRLRPVRSGAGLQLGGKPQRVFPLHAEKSSRPPRRGVERWVRDVRAAGRRGPDQQGARNGGTDRGHRG
ncbi:MAG TPA: hypothetical protein VIK51_21040 [Vicinamibacteria bacterium]